MSSTFLLKVFTGTDAGTMSPSGDGDAVYGFNLLSVDDYDSDGEQYKSNVIVVPESGTSYSFERWLRARFDGSFNLVDNVKVWLHSGSLSHPDLVVNAGVTSSGATPSDAASGVAASAVPESEGSALDITPSADITSDGDFSDYLVVQLVVPSSVDVPGDVGELTYRFRWDEQ